MLRHATAIIIIILFFHFVVVLMNEWMNKDIKILIHVDRNLSANRLMPQRIRLIKWISWILLIEAENYNYLVFSLSKNVWNFCLFILNYWSN